MYDYKALIIGYFNEKNLLHDQYVRHRFHSQTLGDWKCDIALVRANEANNWDVVTTPDSTTGAIRYAGECGYNMIIRPYTASWGWYPDFDKVYRKYDVLTVVPHGANADPDIKVPPSSRDSMVIVTGSDGIASDNSHVDYVCSEENSQSYATGIIAGKLASLYSENNNWNFCRKILNKKIEYE